MKRVVIKVGKNAIRQIKINILKKFQWKCCGADERLLAEPNISMTRDEFVEALGTLLLAIDDSKISVAEMQHISEMVFGNINIHTVPFDYLETINRLTA